MVSKTSKIKVINNLQKGKAYSHPHVDGRIDLNKGGDYNIAFVEIDFDNYFNALERFWPEGREEPRTRSIECSDSGVNVSL